MLDIILKINEGVCKRKSISIYLTIV